MIQPVDVPRESDGERPTVLSLLRDIQAGTVDPTAIPPETRQGVVAHLSAEGYSVPEMAEILRVAERTVKRDRQQVRKANALAPHSDFSGEMAGRLVQEAESAIVLMRRAARDKEAGPGDRINAAQASFNVMRLLVESLQKLAFLPTASAKVQLDMRMQHTPADAQSLLAELDRVSAVLSDGGQVPPAELTTEIETIRLEVQKVAVSERILALEQKSTVEGKEEDHE